MQPESNPQAEQQIQPEPPVEVAAATGPTELPTVDPITWQAPEYIQERRSPWWFIGFWVVVILLLGLAILVRSWTFAILVPAMAATLMIYSHRPPRTLNYALSSKGVYINEKLHPITEFSSFGIIKEESLPSIMLIPVQRFRPGLTIHFPVEAGEAIVDILGSRIPMRELKLDVFDQVIRKLHL